MQPRLIVSVVLLVFVAASVGYLVVTKDGGSPGAPAGGSTGDVSGAANGAPASRPATSAAEQPERRLIAYYFHGTQRCRTCRTIEAYSEQAVREEFADAIAAGEVEWHPVNYDEPGNQHFARDFELVTSSLVLADMRAGEVVAWRRLDQVWSLTDDPAEFREFVRKQLSEMLEPGS